MHNYNIHRLEVLKGTYAKLINRVVQWKSVLANWQLGTRDASNGTFRALQDQHENAMRKNVKFDALVELLVSRRIISAEDLIEKQIEIATRLDQSLETKFPGAKATESGMVIDEPDTFQATKDSLGFDL